MRASCSFVRWSPLALICAGACTSPSRQPSDTATDPTSAPVETRAPSAQASASPSSTAAAPTVASTTAEAVSNADRATPPPAKPACPAPQFLVGERCASPGTAVASARYGSGPDQLGVYYMDQSDWYGPPALVAGTSGEVWVLDANNKRLQLYAHGKVQRSLRIPSSTVTLFAPLSGGEFILYDHAGRSLLTLDQQGESRPLRALTEADGLQFPEFLDARPDGVWMGKWTSAGVEGHRLLDARGDVLEKAELARWAPPWSVHTRRNARTTDEAGLHLVLERLDSGLGEPPTQTSHTLPGERTISAEVHVDGRGQIYFGRRYVAAGRQGQDLHVFNATLGLDRRHVLPQARVGTDWQTQQWLAVSETGEAYVLGQEGEQVVIWRF